MTIRPDRLDGIATHADETFQLKRRRRQFRFGVFIDVAQNVRLALAIGAGTAASQFLQRNETLATVVPFDGQLFANNLNIHRSHGCQVIPCPVISSNSSDFV